MFVTRLQNSPYFCVFKYARAVKQKVWNKAENRERDWGETLKISFFSLASHARRACEARTLRAHKTLTPRFTALLILRKKPTVLQSMLTVSKINTLELGGTDVMKFCSVSANDFS